MIKDASAILCRLKFNTIIELTPGRRAEGGQRQSQEKFFLGGRMGGRRRADKKRRKNFVLGSPTT